MSELKEAIAKAPSGRTRRSPLEGRSVLKVNNKDPNFVYRIVNDVDDGNRVQDMLDRGYAIDEQSVEVGDKRVNKPTSMGSKTHLSVGQGVKAFAMKIKREWYEEDQALKQGQISQLEASTKEKALSGTYGKLDLNARA